MYTYLIFFLVFYPALFLTLILLKVNRYHMKRYSKVTKSRNQYRFLFQQESHNDVEQGTTEPENDFLRICLRRTPLRGGCQQKLDV